MQEFRMKRRMKRTARGVKFSTGRSASKSSSTRKAKRLNVPLSIALEYYRPLKKPVTLRLDADVLAWFKKDGRRYQTRINKALRSLMEREMRAGK
jgi:uncharacterized protein (DUF4415 family)